MLLLRESIETEVLVIGKVLEVKVKGKFSKFPCFSLFYSNLINQKIHFRDVKSLTITFECTSYLALSLSLSLFLSLFLSLSSLSLSHPRI